MRSSARPHHIGYGFQFVSKRSFFKMHGLDIVGLVNVTAFPSTFLFLPHSVFCPAYDFSACPSADVMPSRQNFFCCLPFGNRLWPVDFPRRCNMFFFCSWDTASVPFYLRVSSPSGRTRRQDFIFPDAFPMYRRLFVLSPAVDSTIPACDRRTDRRTDGIAVANTALALRALRAL